MKNECSFSLELASKEDLHGSLGEILKIEFLDDSVLVFTGNRGVFRLDLLPEALSHMLKNEMY